MIEWRLTALRFTSGVGALCMAGMFAELVPNQVPMWLAITAAMLPLIVFVFVRPSEMSITVVRPLQLAASLLYFALAATLTILFFQSAIRTRGWPVYFVGLAVGAGPCAVVLWQEFVALRSQHTVRPRLSETLTRGIPEPRRRQFSIIEAAEDRLLAWARQRNIPLHRIEFVVPFVETDFDLGVWLFYETDSDLARAGENGHAEMAAAFVEALRSLDYPSEWLAGVTFQFDSHEHVERDYEGNYFYRLR